MRGAPRRYLQAWLLFAVMLYTALPRTFFHHCSEGEVAWHLVARSGAVHADEHCPICEAPVPVGPVQNALQLQVLKAFVAVRSSFVVPSAAVSAREIPRQRGPPPTA